MSGTLDDYILYRISKSKETFGDAKLLCNNERWNSAVNRFYYSSFYLVSALLNSKGIKAESHSGVRTQFNLYYIKSGIVSKEYGKLYANLFEWRQESDYADFIDFDRDFVIALVDEVYSFNLVLMNLLTNLKI
jgi:uncharacterized protein (UPF0332 family)